MDVRRMNYFLAVAEELHFGRAAKRLHLSQPPLSIQIRALEEELGVTLFLRDQRNVELTAAGRVLMDETRRILSNIEQAKELTRRAGRGEVGHLAIGFITPVQYSVLPAVLREFRRSYPGVVLQLCEAVSDVQLLDLQYGRLDIGFPTAPIDKPWLEQREVINEPLVAAIPEQHALGASSTPLPIKRLSSEGLIMFPRWVAPRLFDEMTRFCLSAGFNLRIEQEAAHSQTAISLVAAGVGIAIVPGSMRHLQRTGVTYRRFREFGPISRTVVAWSRDHVSEPLANFVKLIEAASTGCWHGPSRPASAPRSKA